MIYIHIITFSSLIYFEFITLYNTYINNNVVYNMIIIITLNSIKHDVYSIIIKYI